MIRLRNDKRQNSFLNFRWSYIRHRENKILKANKTLCNK